MASNQRDVRLGIEIETAGEDGIKRLADAVRNLGKEGDPAAAEYARLANELDRLSQQAGAIQSIQTLREGVEKLTLAEREAGTAAAGATAKYIEQVATVDTLRSAQERASAEVAQAKKAYDDLKLAFQTIRNDGKLAAESQEQFNSRLSASRQLVDEQNRALKTRRDELIASNKEVSKAEAVEGSLRKEFEFTTQAAQKTGAALREQSGALGSVQAAATALGLDVANLATAQQTLSTATRESVLAAEAFRTSTAESAAAMRALESAAAVADAEMAALAGTLRATEQAARQYVTATEAAAAAGTTDAEVTRARVTAAEALIVSERQLDASQKDLATARNASRAALVAEAEAFLLQTRAAEASAAATATLVNNATRLGTTLDGTAGKISRIGTLSEEAFGQLGVRSLQAIEAEVNRTDIAMARLERDFRAGRISADDLSRALSSASVKLATLNAEARNMPALPGQFERISASINNVIGKFGALGAAIATIGIAVKPVLDATISLQQMERVLTQVTGSSEIAAQQIDALRKIATDSGQNFSELGESYAKFAASALQSGLSIQQTQEVFRDVAMAAGNLGLSSDQAKRALEALSQMASKGVVSMEELRQQLGDALPGVLPLLAKQLGLTQAQMIKLIESGQLLAAEAIPAIGKSLRSLEPASGSVDSMVASWNRFKNVILEAGTVLVEGPIGQAAGAVLGAFAGVVRDVTVVVVGFSEALKLTGKTALSVFDLLKGNISFKQFGEQISDFALESGDRLAKFEETAYGAGEATQGLANDINKLGTSFAKLAVDSQTAIDKADLLAQSAQKNVEGKKAEAKAVETLTGLLGDETAKRQGALEAAQILTKATEDQVKADEAVVATLTRAKDATIAKAKADGIAEEAIKGAVAALDKKIIKAEADASKTRDQADAARAHALSLELAAQAIGNNAGRIAEYKLAVAAATTALNEKIRAMEHDAATSADVKRAAEQLAKAKGLLRDAIDDVSKALEQQLALMKADAELQKAAIGLEIEKAKNAQRAAEAAGNAAEASRQAIRVEQLQQSLTVSGIELKRKEAAATLESLAVQESELRLSGQLTDEIQRQIDIKRRQAQATMLDAEASREANKSKAAEVQALKDGTLVRDQYTGAVGRGTSATQTNTSAQAENNRVYAALPPLLRQAAEDAARLGVTLRDNLPSAAGVGTQGVIESFERLKASGGASVKELGSAFVNMANEVIQSSGGIVPEWVKVEAAANKAVIEVDGFGKSTVRAAKDGEYFGDVVYGATNHATEGVKGTTKAVDALADSIKAAAKNAADLNELGKIGTAYVNSPAYKLEQKQKAGTLGTGDVAGAQANYDAAVANLAHAQKNGTAVSFEGMQSFLAEANKARTILETAKMSVQTGTGARPGNTGGAAPSSTAASSGSTHKVVITLNGQTTTINVANADDGTELKRFLDALAAAASRTGP